MRLVCVCLGYGCPRCTAIGTGVGATRITPDDLLQFRARYGNDAAQTDALRTLVAERDDARAEVKRLREALAEACRIALAKDERTDPDDNPRIEELRDEFGL